MNLIEKAIVFATVAHEGQNRKGTKIPYIIHPITVGFLLQQEGCNEYVIVAGILHDTVEDTNTTIEDIKREFGDEVATIVEGASEPDKSLSWEDRKAHTIEFLKGASFETRLVACADKLHNISTIYDEYKSIGDKVWDRFNRGKKQQGWYYKSLYSSLNFKSDIPEDNNIYKQLGSIINELFE